MVPRVFYFVFGARMGPKLGPSLGPKKLVLKIRRDFFGAHMGPKNPDRLKKIWWVPKIEIWAPKIEIWDRKSNGMLDLSACNSVMEMNRIRLYFWYWGLKSRFFLACGAIFFACGALLIPNHNAWYAL